MTLLEAALACPRCVLSVMGDHAGEATDAIFLRKIADIERVGRTFWLMNSQKARPVHVQKNSEVTPAYTIFIQPATLGGARPATKRDAAKEFSSDGVIWKPLPEGLSPVTGKLNRAAALVFDMMTTNVNGVLDLWNYGDSSETHSPVKFILGCSTVCAIQEDMKSHPKRMQSRYRGIVAVARLVEPYCVWIR